MEHCVLDVSSLEGTNAFCSADNFPVIRKMAGKLPLRAAHNIGNGNYHYLTLFFLERIERDFALLYFDNHPDNQDDAFDAGMLSCGNWVKQAVEALPHLRAVRWTNSSESIGNLPDNLPVYISIDLDVLGVQFIHTVWDQGTMTPQMLKSGLAEAIRSHEVLGADICGCSSENEPVVRDLYSFFGKI